MSLLQANHLKKTYKGRVVVNDVSLSIESGSVVGLLGPNGAGKTTSFYIIVGIISTENGSVLLDDQDITHMPMHLRARAGLGYLPQENSIFRKLSVEENLMSVMELQPKLSKTERLNKVNDLLEEFHIDHLRKSTGISLSGGERRREGLPGAGGPGKNSAGAGEALGGAHRAVRRRGDRHPGNAGSGDPP